MKHNLLLLLAIIPCFSFAQPTFSDYEQYHMLEMGKSHYQQGQYEAALEALGEVLDTENRQAEAYQLRAKACFMLGRFEQALADFDQAIALSRREAASMKNHAYGGYRPLDIEEVGLADPRGEQSRQWALALLYCDRGATRYQLKQYREALADFEQALALFPSLEVAQTYGEQAREMLRTYPPASQYAGEAPTPNDNRYLPPAEPGTRVRPYITDSQAPDQQPEIPAGGYAYRPTEGSRLETYRPRVEPESSSMSGWNEPQAPAAERVYDNRPDKPASGYESKEPAPANPEIRDSYSPGKRATISDWLKDRKLFRRKTSREKEKKPTASAAKKPFFSMRKQQLEVSYPQVGAQTASYVQIEHIANNEQHTTISFKVTNYENRALELFLERPGSDGAFFIVDAANQREYRMTGASGLRTRPYTTTLEPGQSLRFSVDFERLDEGVKRIHLLEGNMDSENRWNFYDINLE